MFLMILRREITEKEKFWAHKSRNCCLCSSSRSSTVSTCACQRYVSLGLSHRKRAEKYSLLKIQYNEKQQSLEKNTLPSATWNTTSRSADFGKCQRDSSSPRQTSILAGSTGYLSFQNKIKIGMIGTLLLIPSAHFGSSRTRCC